MGQVIIVDQNEVALTMPNHFFTSFVALHQEQNNRDESL